MSAPEFDVSIGADGKVKGVSGEECVKLTDMIRDIVGKEDSREKTAEYYGPGGSVRIDSHVKGRTGG